MLYNAYNSLLFKVYYKSAKRETKDIESTGVNIKIDIKMPN